MNWVSNIYISTSATMAAEMFLFKNWAGIFGPLCTHTVKYMCMRCEYSLEYGGSLFCAMVWTRKCMCLVSNECWESMKLTLDYGANWARGKQLRKLGHHLQAISDLGWHADWCGNITHIVFFHRVFGFQKKGVFVFTELMMNIFDET